MLRVFLILPQARAKVPGDGQELQNTTSTKHGKDDT